MFENNKRNMWRSGCIVSIIIGTIFIMPVVGQGADAGIPNLDSLYTAYAAKKIQVSPAQERDRIFSLLAYAVVLKNWQVSSDTGRGYNIGSVLVDPGNKVIYWARNCVNVTRNSSQHGEVRLMNCYMATARTRNLKGHTIYTTLEPCAQCAGMMKLASVYRTVYGQIDPGFGKAHERLDLNSYAWKPDSGYTPYPRHVISDTLAAAECEYMDYLYKVYLDTCKDSSITRFLSSAGAHDAYTKFLNFFLKYPVQYQENYAIWKQAIIYYDSVPDHYVQLCPPE